MKKLFFSCLTMLSLVVCSMGFSACSSDEEVETDKDQIIGYTFGASYGLDDFKMNYSVDEGDEYPADEFCQGIKEKLSYFISQSNDSVLLDKRTAQEKYEVLLNETKAYFDSLQTIDPKKYNAEIEIHFLVYTSKHMKYYTDFDLKQQFDFTYNGAAYHQQEEK
jgi:basic membrane lipoprotein Med (substrate-binding protein (PBP1-ABC) superfamily)